MGSKAVFNLSASKRKVSDESYIYVFFSLLFLYVCAGENLYLLHIILVYVITLIYHQ